MTALDEAPGEVLLVPGAWHTGRCWDTVARRLRAQSIPVAVAELHRGSLAADTAAAAEAMSSLPGPVVACGHSYGGMVITGLPPERIAHLVYLAAPMPDAGETAMALLAAHPTELLTRLTHHPDGSTTIDPDLAGGLFCPQLSADRRSAYTAALVPQDMTAAGQLPVGVAWRVRPSTYVVCAEDRVLHPELQRELSQRATHRLTWASDHAAFVSHEDDTVALLVSLAAAAASASSATAG